MGATRLLLLLFLSLLSSFPQPTQQQSAGEIQGLMKLKQSLTDGRSSLATWVPNASPCANWAGIVCFNGRITGLHLSDMGLSGKIDVDALIQIRSLRTLSFVNNSFSGPIPEFNRLGTIKSLLLSTNRFSGPIPPDFFSHLASLKKVWLSENAFTGPIPPSIVELALLKELHLEDNQFEGDIPPMKQDLTSFSVANNNLQGPVPDALAKFGPDYFGGKGNEGLCGKPLPRPCGDAAVASGSDSLETGGGEDGGSSPGWAFRVVLVLIVVAVVVFVFKSVKRRRSEARFGVMGRLNSEAESVVHVDVPSAYQRTTSSSRGSVTSRKGGGDSRRGSSRSGGMGDLVMVNDEKGAFGMQDLMKAAAEVLGNGGLGSAYKAAMANGLSVVVKRMREMNKIGRDVFDAEMRQFGRIRNKNILTPLAYHYRREEKLVISEYMAKGSLLYVLHGDRGTCHADLNWPTRLKIVKGIARGLGYLYTEFSTYELPHGNLKSSNVLLSDDYEPLLSDFAFHPLINPQVAVQAMFAYKSPDYVQYGKISQKTDVYCLGIIILEIITGKFPSQYHNNGKGGTDVVQWVFAAISERREVELIDPELQNDILCSQQQMLQLLHVGAACTESNPDQRLNMKEAIRRIEELQV